MRNLVYLCRREQSSTVVEVLQIVEECLQNEQWERGYNQIQLAYKKVKNPTETASVQLEFEKLQNAWIASMK
jgi:hypothetical protein